MKKESEWIGDYPRQQLTLSSIHSKLLPEEQRLRMLIMNDIINHQKPVSFESLVSMKEMSPELLKKSWDGLIRKNAMVMNDQQEATFVYPVSALPTPHLVTLADKRQFSAMCGIDAIGAAFTFQQDTSISSQCSQCGEPISLEVNDKQLINVHPANAYVLHVDLNQIDDWAASC
ncbi:Alkylmercury lyase [Tindallia magadiensis]|uniref:Alkylmercury lyase n=2 Tax=Tindallia magadiensis TaxID=69895 RepID=A0A1I3ERP3_9FIRM|nr:Alkylmercury lyase [Tindallia magadiensis]